jgi:1-acyl-sn-glycerol-3-phosphate acyltransferase
VTKKRKKAAGTLRAPKDAARARSKKLPEAETSAQPAQRRRAKKAKPRENARPRAPRLRKDSRFTTPVPPAGQPANHEGPIEDELRVDSVVHEELVESTRGRELDDDDNEETEVPELGIGAPHVPPHIRFESEAQAPPSVATPGLSQTADVAAQIRVLEARLDGLIQRNIVTEPVEPEPQLTLAPPLDEAAQDHVAAEYMARQWGREALRSRFEEVDDFGLDPSFEAKVRPGLELLYRHYFRVRLEGIENVPSTGRAVIVANHSGTLPLDGAMLRAAIRLDHPSARDLRWLAEDFVFHLPFLGVFLNRIGAVRACPENAERLLEKDALVAVFPEGVQGIKKLFSERYRLQRFGRGGYIRLCLRKRTPLVPCAIIGAEETNPLIYRFEWLAELFRLPYLPVTPTFPLLGPVGLLPAPTRWTIRFGEPLSFDQYGPEAADDTVLIGRLSERVRASIQSLLDSGLRDRKSVWFG